MSFSVSHLPDVCLLHILARIPLFDLMHSVGRVCTNWARIQREEVGRRRTSTRTLVLLQNSFVNEHSSSENVQDDSDSDSDSVELKHEYILKYFQVQDNPYGSNLITHVRRDDKSPWAQLPSLEQINFDILGFPGHELSERFTSRLMDIFPNITHLTVDQEKVDPDNANLDQLIRLIQHYSNSLITLKLDFVYGDKNKKCPAFEPNVPTLFDTINQLASLRHLTMNVSFPNMNIEPRLTILSQLATFTSNRFEPQEILISSLRQLVDGNVRLDCKIDALDLDDLSELDPRLLAKFVRLYVGTGRDLNLLFPFAFDSLNLLCSQLTSITTLELIISRMPMTMLARCLAQLPGLIHLNVNFWPRTMFLRFVRIPQEGDEEEEKDKKKDDEKMNENKPKPVIVPLPSVRLLTLSITTASHHDTKRLHIPEIFPNLQVLHLDHTPKECDECGFDYYNRSQMYPQIVNCMRLVRQPFRNCGQLHTIKLQTDKQHQSCIPHNLINRDEL